MKNNTSLTPYEALQKVYDGFGQKGFIDVVKERQSVLEKCNRKRWWQMIKSNFTPPKLFVTAVVFIIAFSLSPYLSGAAQGFIIQGIIVGFPLLQLTVVLIKNVQAKKNLLLLQQGNTHSWITFFLAYICSPVPSNILLQNQHIVAINPSFFACWLTMIFVLESAAFEANNKLRQTAMHLYPEAFKKA